MTETPAAAATSVSVTARSDLRTSASIAVYRYTDDGDGTRNRDELRARGPDAAQLRRDRGVRLLALRLRPGAAAAATRAPLLVHDDRRLLGPLVRRRGRVGSRV